MKYWKKINSPTFSVNKRILHQKNSGKLVKGILFEGLSNLLQKAILWWFTSIQPVPCFLASSARTSSTALLDLLSLKDNKASRNEITSINSRSGRCSPCCYCGNCLPFSPTTTTAAAATTATANGYGYYYFIPSDIKKTIYTTCV